MEERLHKVLAAVGVASRRESERLIAEGRVAVDGQTIIQMGVKVDPDRQSITLDGRPIGLAPKKVYVLLNKPKGYVTTRSDPHATHTVMELVSEVPVPIYPVGRLDRETEGVLILTNDGDFTQKMTHPRHEVSKMYQVHVEGVPDDESLELLRTGVRLEDGVTGPAYVRVLVAGGGRAVLEITIREGRNRQVRRMMDAIGHPVEYLRRIAIGPVSVRNLPKGAWRYLSQKELHALLRMAERGEMAPSAPPRRESAPAAGTSSSVRPGRPPRRRERAPGPRNAPRAGAMRGRPGSALVAGAKSGLGLVRQAVAKSEPVRVRPAGARARGLTNAPRAGARKGRPGSALVAGAKSGLGRV